jgi:hypothetical protein
MTKSITICALVVGLIGLFTAVARGQQAGPAQPPAAGMIAGSSQDSAGGPSESDVAKANNSSESRWRSWERSDWTRRTARSWLDTPASHW